MKWAWVPRWLRAFKGQLTSVTGSLTLRYSALRQHVGWQEGLGAEQSVPL